MSGPRRTSFSRVFVPVDSGRTAMRGARLAARLARATGGRVRACYVVDDSFLRAGKGVIDIRQPLREELEVDGRRALRRVELACRRLDVPYSGTLVEGDVVEQIVQAARRFRADVIVIGSRGPTGLRGLLRGSRVPALLQRAGRPVLIAPPERERTGGGG